MVNLQMEIFFFFCKPENHVVSDLSGLPMLVRGEIRVYEQSAQNTKYNKEDAIPCAEHLNFFFENNLFLKLEKHRFIFVVSYGTRRSFQSSCKKKNQGNSGCQINRELKEKLIPYF